MTGQSKRDDLHAIITDPVFIEVVKNIVRDVLVRELISSYIPERSIPPTKIKPVDLDGNEPPNGTALTYDATEDVVTF